MSADVVPFPRRNTDRAFPGSVERSSAALDVLAERCRLADARDAGFVLPMPPDERGRAVRWAADMILQIEGFDNA